MGFEAKGRTYTLEFGEGTDWEGLKVTTSGMTIEEWAIAVGLADGGMTMSKVLHGVQIFAGHVESWNLERKGVPVPVPPLDPGAEDPAEARRAAVLREDRDMIMDCSSAWVREVSGVTGPLEPSSDSTEPSSVSTAPLPEVFLPTEPL